MSANKLSEVLAIPSHEAARRLLGAELKRTFDNGETVTVRIVETEAYDALDEASHSFRGQTARTAAMFGPAGHSYVYFTYGMHFCFNVVTGPVGHGAGVLIRAVEPLDGLEVILRNRYPQTGHSVTNGPGKVCRALGIDRDLYGHDLSIPPLELCLRPELPANKISQSPRIGITKATDIHWRFFITGNPFVSKFVTNITKTK